MKRVSELMLKNYLTKCHSQTFAAAVKHYLYKKGVGEECVEK